MGARSQFDFGDEDDERDVWDNLRFQSAYHETMEFMSAAETAEQGGTDERL